VILINVSNKTSLGSQLIQGSKCLFVCGIREFAYAKLVTFFGFSSQIKVKLNPSAVSVGILRDYAKDRREDEVFREFDLWPICGHNCVYQCWCRRWVL